MQVAGVHETARYTSHVLMATDDSCIDGYRRLVDAVAPHGTVLFGQLFHPGREVMECQDGSLPVAVAPPACPTSGSTSCRGPWHVDEIDEIVGRLRGRGPAPAGGRAPTGVEIVASHGYLPSQFLNPAVNLRSDHYGGSDENRLRFLRDILAGVREGDRRRDRGGPADLRSTSRTRRACRPTPPSTPAGRWPARASSTT